MVTLAALPRCDNRARSRKAVSRSDIWFSTLLASDKELSDFLKSVDKRAFKRALYAVRDEDAALDIVQDTMIRLSEKYADRPPAELPLLFQRACRSCAGNWRAS